MRDFLKRRSGVILLILSFIVSLLLLEAGVRMFLPETPFHGGYQINSAEETQEALRIAREKPEDSAVPVRIPMRNRKLHEKLSEREEYYRSLAVRWGDIDTNETKILVIGDSHVQLGGSSDDGWWYDYIEKSIPETEVFAIGSSGSGTTQEYLLLNQSIDIIDPDIVLWQFCQNDYRNDAYSMNRARWPLTRGWIKPYLIDGEIQYRSPSPLINLRTSWKTIDFLVSKYQLVTLQEKRKDRNSMLWRLAETHFIEEGSTPEFEKTERMIERAISTSRENEARFILLKINGPRVGRYYYALCDRINATCWNDIDDYVVKAGNRMRVPVDRGDGHWSAEGNKLGGQYIADKLEKIVDARRG
ncbi:MAG: SGNH/GDSL hydrolase family protein [Candidatus Nanohaloarchaeota archaeon QJJ-7]|nr:SGNH/GDSL hydrolase family protein [Candidatus Nanohaloarchaeota archaeon QJJ-7]